MLCIARGSKDYSSDRVLSNESPEYARKETKITLEVGIVWGVIYIDVNYWLIYYTGRH